jgi:dienelactone hydrolase
MGTRHDVELEGHGGVVLRGWLDLPEPDAATGAGVVMAHGFSAVKEMRLDRFAEVFCDAGLAVLTYDHRNLGASDGEPRQQINPWAQARDYRAALGWLAERPEVDAERLGIWGSSYSGGEVMVVGACDDRAKAVVANVPFAGLPGVDYSHPADVTARFERLRAALLDDSGAGPADTDQVPVGPMAVVVEPGDDRPAFLPQPESSEYFLLFAEDGPEPTSWRNEVTVVSMLGDPPWDPGVCAGFIAPTPLLMVVATHDELAETAVSVAAWDRAGEPKELIMVEGHHFVPYEGDEFDLAAGAAARFFTHHL